MNPQPNGASPDEAILEVRGLTKVFGSGPSAVRAVDGVDLSVRRGEIVLIMGPSGSGKTTLLTMIGGLLRPTSGSVRINGYDITAMKESELPQVRRHLVGFVFQTFNLLES
ncbi:MAG TPA: ATP-binding cassette domain-containing protein, partial [Dehalococcoidia bacterium]|nr:ATP-binding cassette domain-containing protein [Dehalococcoidia bacterium]